MKTLKSNFDLLMKDGEFSHKELEALEDNLKREKELALQWGLAKTAIEREKAVKEYEQNKSAFDQLSVVKKLLNEK